MDQLTLLEPNPEDTLSELLFKRYWTREETRRTTKEPFTEKQFDESKFCQEVVPPIF